jgi:hypothetical protein
VHARISRVTLVPSLRGTAHGSERDLPTGLELCDGGRQVAREAAPHETRDDQIGRRIVHLFSDCKKLGLNGEKYAFL